MAAGATSGAHASTFETMRRAGRLWLGLCLAILATAP